MSNNVKVNVWKLLESIRLIKGSCPCQTADGNSTALQLMWGWRLKIINWFCPHVEFGTKPLLFLVNRSFQTLNHPSPAKQSRVESKKLPLQREMHFCGSTLPGVCSLLRPIVVAAFQLSAGKEVALGGSAQFALYWAEVKPQWGRQSDRSCCQSAPEFTSSH